MRSLISTYRRKNLALLLASVFFIMLAYYFAFGKTIKLVNENANFETQIVELESAPEQLAILKANVSKMNNNLGYVGEIELSSKDYILDFVSAYMDTTEVFIRTMPKTILEDKNGYQLETNVLVLQGPFKELVQLMYLIESKQKISKIASAKFELRKDLSSKKSSLSMLLNLQNINL